MVFALVSLAVSLSDLFDALLYHGDVAFGEDTFDEQRRRHWLLYHAGRYYARDGPSAAAAVQGGQLVVANSFDIVSSTRPSNALAYNVHVFHAA